MKTPRIIRLNEVPDQGLTYTYSNQSGELDPALKDLIGEKPYHVDLQIVPHGQTFQISGKIQSGLDLQCSLCGIDFEMPLKLDINEMLVVVGKRPQGQFARPNHLSDFKADTPFCTELESSEFDMGEFVREQIAVQEPTRPLGKPDCEIACENYNNLKEKGFFSNQEAPQEHPFEVLKTLKLNS